MSAKSGFLNSTSQSYAKALYELANENSELDKVEDGINGLNTTIRKIVPRSVSKRAECGSSSKTLH